MPSPLPSIPSTPCGHTYSKSAIEEMLRGKRSIQCPVSGMSLRPPPSVGCKYEVSRQTLVRDTEMEELLVCPVVPLHPLGVQPLNFILLFCSTQRNNKSPRKITML